VKFTGRRGQPCAGGLAGGGLSAVAAINFDGRDKRLNDVELLVACDVDNPLTGEEGAARTYAPQKGASESQVDQLDEALGHLASLIDHVDPRTPGAGAAGGLGFGLIAFAGAKLTSGIELVLDAVDFDARLRDADLCLTGEGKLDGQSLRGKAVGGVVRAAGKHDVPVIAVAGTVDAAADRLLDEGLLAAISICRGPVSLDTARRNAAELLEAATMSVVRAFVGGRGGWTVVKSEVQIKSQGVND
jgi:glycerate kinase